MITVSSWRENESTSLIAKMEGIIETQKEEIQYLREKPINTNATSTRLISQLKSKQFLTSEELAQTNNYLKTKKDFLAARQQTIEELKNCFNKLEKKFTKQEIIGEIGNAVSNVGGGITKVIIFVFLKQ